LVGFLLLYLTTNQAHCQKFIVDGSKMVWGFYPVVQGILGGGRLALAEDGDGKQRVIGMVRDQTASRKWYIRQSQRLMHPSAPVILTRAVSGVKNNTKSSKGSQFIPYLMMETN
jgi:hypothetical protein